MVDDELEMEELVGDVRARFDGLLVVLLVLLLLVGEMRMAPEDDGDAAVGTSEEAVEEEAVEEEELEEASSPSQEPNMAIIDVDRRAVCKRRAICKRRAMSISRGLYMGALRCVDGRWPHSISHNIVGDNLGQVVPIPIPRRHTWPHLRLSTIYRIVVLLYILILGPYSASLPPRAIHSTKRPPPSYLFI